MGRSAKPDTKSVLAFIRYICTLVAWFFLGLVVLPFVIGLMFPQFLFVTMRAWGSLYSLKTWISLALLVGLAAIIAGARLAAKEMMKLLWSKSG